jgi:hypothetical protein
VSARQWKGYRPAVLLGRGEEPRPRVGRRNGERETCAGIRFWWLSCGVKCGGRLYGDNFRGTKLER